MLIALNLIAFAIAVVYFGWIGGLLVFAFLDRQKDTLTENRVTAVILFLALIVMPAIGIFYSLR